VKCGIDDLRRVTATAGKVQRYFEMLRPVKVMPERRRLLHEDLAAQIHTPEQLGIVSDAFRQAEDEAATWIQGIVKKANDTTLQGAEIHEDGSATEQVDVGKRRSAGDVLPRKRA
jgi:hypothetical protein